MFKKLSLIKNIFNRISTVAKSKTIRIISKPAWFQFLVVHFLLTDRFFYFIWHSCHSLQYVKTQN